MTLRRTARRGLHAVAPGWLHRRDIRIAADRELEVRLLPWLCRLDSTAIDIGANKGLYVAHLLSLAGRVVAFEPLPEMQAVLRRFYPNVQVEPVALSDGPGVAELRLPRDNTSWATLAATNRLELSATELVSTMVERATLDSYDFHNVGLIKIDVEGHEEAVLRGAAATLARELPNLVIEVEERHNPGSVERVAALLAEHGYAGSFLDGSTVRPIRELDLAADQDPTNVGPVGKTGRYINNFVFVPADRADWLNRSGQNHRLNVGAAGGHAGVDERGR